MRAGALLGLASLAAPSPAAGQGEYGTIKGRLVWGGDAIPDLPPKLKPGDPTAKDPEVCAVREIPNESLVVDPATKGVRNGFAYVVTPKGKNPEAETALREGQPKVTIDQKGCTFVPHCAALIAGQALVFTSSDPVSHNVHTNALTNQPINVVVP